MTTRMRTLADREPLTDKLDRLTSRINDRLEKAIARQRGVQLSQIEANQIAKALDAAARELRRRRG